MFGVGKRSKLGKNERDQRKIMDLRGSRFELLSQLPSHMKLEKTVSGCCGGLSLCPLFRTEAFILQLPDVLTADSLSPFEVVLHGCSSHPVTGQWLETNTYLFALIWDNSEEPELPLRLAEASTSNFLHTLTGAVPQRTPYQICILIFESQSLFSGALI